MEDRTHSPAIMNKLIQKVLLSAFLCVFGVTIAFAQQKRITGTVKDVSGNAVTNASVVVKGAKGGVTTGDDGSFVINVNGSNAVLVISSVGYKTQEVSVGDREFLAVSLQNNDNLQQEVVVTALGIKRERKSLGYAIQEVKYVRSSFQAIVPIVDIVKCCPDGGILKSRRLIYPRSSVG